jgi:hypothetical protein
MTSELSSTSITSLASEGGQLLAQFLDRNFAWSDMGKRDIAFGDFERQCHLGRVTIAE